MGRPWTSQNTFALTVFNVLAAPIYAGIFVENIWVKVVACVFVIFGTLALTVELENDARRRRERQ